MVEVTADSGGRDTEVAHGLIDAQRPSLGQHLQYGAEAFVALHCAPNDDLCAVMIDRMSYRSSLVRRCDPNDGGMVAGGNYVKQEIDSQGDCWRRAVEAAKNNKAVLP